MTTNETFESIGRWSLDTFGPGDDPKVHVGRILDETLEAAYAAGLDFDEILRRASKAGDKAHREFGNLPLADAKRAMRKALPGELADIVVTVAAAASRIEVDIPAEVHRKMAVNRARKWKCFGDGTGQHIKSA